MVVDNGCLKLSWYKVKTTGINIYKYKILYTDNEWKKENLTFVEGTDSFCLISNILPSKIYRFRVVSCLKNSVESIPSEELEYQSGSKYANDFMLCYVLNSNIMIDWTLHFNDCNVCTFLIFKFKICYNANQQPTL